MAVAPNPTIGQRLDEPGGIFAWLNHAVISLAVLRVVVDVDLCGKLEDTPISIAELAARCNLPADKTLRFVRFLAAEAIVTLTPDGKVAATSRSRRLREWEPSIRMQSRSAETGPSLLEACRRGMSAYELRFGKPFFEHLPEQPEFATAFNGQMAILTRRIEQFVFTQHEFRPFTRVVDVGGNHGELLLGLLARHEHARGVLFDLPDVVARVSDELRASPHSGRVEIVAGDFFTTVPAGDLYLLKQILHDWNDEECIAILKSVRAAIAAGGRIAIIDYLLPETPAPTGAHTMDVAMMVWATGRERSLSEFAALFTASGFALDRVTENPQGQSVFEAVPI